MFGVFVNSVSRTEGCVIAFKARANRPQKILCHPTSVFSIAGGPVMGDSESGDMIKRRYICKGMDQPVRGGSAAATAPTVIKPAETMKVRILTSRIHMFKNISKVTWIY